MRHSNTYNASVALAALRMINKSRQCAKRGDVTGMCDNAELAYMNCACTPYVPTTERDNTSIVAYKVTHQICRLYITAYKGDCSTFVRSTQHLDCDVHEMVEAMKQARNHGHLS